MSEHAAREAELEPIREAVRALCAEFPANTGARSIASAPNPTEFVQALTKAGFSRGTDS